MKLNLYGPILCASHHKRHLEPSGQFLRVCYDSRKRTDGRWIPATSESGNQRLKTCPPGLVCKDMDFVNDQPAKLDTGGGYEA